uniref:Putative mitochondrial arginyl-trna synthetase n=1 Tax=Ixodes ricinus TaxID=34613 RepID=A0A0K8R552_IXORI
MLNQTPRQNKNPAFRAEALRQFSDLESGNKVVVSQWKLFRELSIVNYTELYKRLGVTFDVIDGESNYSKGGPRTLGSSAHGVKTPVKRGRGPGNPCSRRGGRGGLLCATGQV